MRRNPFHEIVRVRKFAGAAAFLELESVNYIFYGAAPGTQFRFAGSGNRNDRLP